MGEAYANYYGPQFSASREISRRGAEFTSCHRISMIPRNLAEFDKTIVD